ncbi:uncharacterized protein LOC134785461 [Penaeus indicus]|uniref:uncharacterized protein LOC134785461 n=1 Tax=Penaeus indicus TaxID=29960 RepID=UPI00300CC211
MRKAPWQTLSTNPPAAGRSPTPGAGARQQMRAEVAAQPRLTPISCSPPPLLAHRLIGRWEQIRVARKRQELSLGRDKSLMEPRPSNQRAFRRRSRAVVGYGGSSYKCRIVFGRRLLGSPRGAPFTE